MYRADVAVFAPGTTNPVLNGERNIRRLTGRANDMRVSARPREMDEHAKRWQIFLVSRKQGLDIIGDGDEHRDIARRRVPTRHLPFEAGILPRLCERPKLVIAAGRNLPPGSAQSAGREECAAQGSR